MRTATSVRSAPLAVRSPTTLRRVRDGLPRQAPPSDRLEIVHITAEYWPFARTGGLGEAVAGLAAGQADNGAGVTVIMPFYRTIRESTTQLRQVGASFFVPTEHGPQAIQLYGAPTSANKPRVLFVDHPASFDRDEIYGDGGRDYDDNGERFALLSFAAIEALLIVAPTARVVHAHDWHTAPALAYLRARGSRRQRHQMLRVLSVHNAAFQGQFPLSRIAGLTLPGVVDLTPAFEWYGRANFLKAGLTCSDLTFTVSPNHAHELCIPEGGFGLHNEFAGLGDQLAGVLNGIDTASWDPSNDPSIPSHYSRNNLAGKPQCKSALQRECGLRELRATPLFAMCTRLAEQKGLDLVLAADLVARTDAQFVFVGRGEPRYENALRNLAAAAPDRIALRLDFSDDLEHRVMAGADALLMPSLFEPCGLTQMRAQRYGAIPIVRKVGGLVDTVDDEVTGFVFDEYMPGAFLARVHTAVNRYAQRGLWREMTRRAMLRDFGWGRAADHYAARYRRAMRGLSGRLTDGVAARHGMAV
jgi:starch synthase